MERKNRDQFGKNFGPYEMNSNRYALLGSKIDFKSYLRSYQNNRSHISELYEYETLLIFSSKSIILQLYYI